jgi:hypothetical protein
MPKRNLSNSLTFIILLNKLKLIYDSLREGETGLLWRRSLTILFFTNCIFKIKIRKKNS